MSLEREVGERKKASEGREKRGMERGSETLPTPWTAKEGARKALVRVIDESGSW